MRFFYIGSFRFPCGDAASARVLNNARLLTDLGHTVKFISFGGHSGVEFGSWDNYMGYSYQVTYDIDLSSTKEKIGRLFHPYPQCRQLLKLNKQEVDVIICYDQSLLFSCWLKLFSKRNGIKVVFDVAEWYGPNENIGGVLSPIFISSELFMLLPLSSSKNRILISSYLESHYPKGNNILLPPLVDKSELKWSRRPHPSLLPAHYSGKRLLYSGTPSYKDALPSLIKAMLVLLKRGEQLQLVIVGVDENRGLSFFESPSDYSNFKESFLFIGRVSQDIVPQYYNLCDFSVLLREKTRKNMAGFPTKMAESMAAGCPVLINDFSDVLQYVKDGENAIVVDSLGIDAISKALQRILSLDAETINRMKDMAMKTGESCFDYRNYISKMDVFISKLK